MVESGRPVDRSDVVRGGRQPFAGASGKGRPRQPVRAVQRLRYRVAESGLHAIMIGLPGLAGSSGGAVRSTPQRSPIPTPAEKIGLLLPVRHAIQARNRCAYIGISECQAIDRVHVSRSTDAMNAYEDRSSQRWWPAGCGECRLPAGHALPGPITDRRAAPVVYLVDRQYRRGRPCTPCTRSKDQPRSQCGPSKRRRAPSGCDAGE